MLSTRLLLCVVILVLGVASKPQCQPGLCEFVECDEPTECQGEQQPTEPCVCCPDCVAARLSIPFVAKGTEGDRCVFLFPCDEGLDCKGDFAFLSHIIGTCTNTTDA